MSTTPHLVLKARGRRAKHNNSPIVATVCGFYGNASRFGGDEYAHPRIEFTTSERGSDHIDVVFQQHVVHVGAENTKLAPSILQHGGRRWSHCYGARLEARSCEYSGARRWIRRVLDLLDRAATVDIPGKHVGDDLMEMIVKLRKIGVEVRIHNDAIGVVRGKHPRHRAAYGVAS